MKCINDKGNCICIGCNQVIPHRAGKPCREERCPTCGKALMREGGYHHLLFLKKQETKNNQSE